MLLLEKIFKIINESGLDYCIQNKYEMMPENIPSDIDMMYRGADEKFLDALVVKIAKDCGLLIVQKIVQGYYQFSYMLTYPYPQEKFQLLLDFYGSISWKGIYQVMPADDMIEGKRFYKCFYVPNYYVELKYMWLRRTIKHDLNEEHIAIAKGLFAKNSSCFKKKLIDDFGEQMTMLILKILETEDKQLFYDNYNVFLKSIQVIANKNTTITKRCSSYWFKMSRIISQRLVHTCGLSVAFLSPDGGGKSTIIKQIEETCAGSFCGIQYIYTRPHLLKNPGAYSIMNPHGEGDGNPNPHGKELHGRIKSLCRFLFYVIDYILGTLLKIYPMKVMKKLVIFDRFYYDYLVDLQRYQYNLPKWIPLLFRHVIPSPDIVFVLDGLPEVLYARKKELTLEELKYQVGAYRKVANMLKSSQLIDVNRDIATVAQEVTHAIILKKARKVAKQMHIKIDITGFIK